MDHDLRESLRQLLDDLDQLLLRCDVRRRDNDDVTRLAVYIAADRIDDEPVLEGLAVDPLIDHAVARVGRRGIAVGDDLNAEEIAAAADIADIGPGAER